IFFNFAGVGPNVGLRTASGVLDGKEQSCLLMSRGPQAQSIIGSRNWLEDEYCMDQASGLLTVHSPVPGLYIHYLYSAAPNFHGLFVPTGFQIEQAGKILIEAKTESVTDPPDRTDPMFSNAGLTAAGAGREMTGPVTVSDVMPSKSCLTSANPAGCTIQ